MAAGTIAHDNVDWCPIEWQNLHQKSFLIDVNYSAWGPSALALG